jgi:HK97 gp10 family phage protein
MSTTVTIDVTGLDRILRELGGELDAFLDEEAEAIVTDVKQSFGTSPAGRSYERGSVTVVASQAGYPPNVDTGTLRASIRWERSGHLERTVMDGVEYGIYLEDGTERIAPRPFMRPAFDEVQVGIGRRLREHLGRWL